MVRPSGQNGRQKLPLEMGKLSLLLVFSETAIHYDMSTLVIGRFEQEPSLLSTTCCEVVSTVKGNYLSDFHLRNRKDRKNNRRLNNLSPNVCFLCGRIICALLLLSYNSHWTSICNGADVECKTSDYALHTLHESHFTCESLPSTSKKSTQFFRVNKRPLQNRSFQRSTETATLTFCHESLQLVDQTRLSRESFEVVGL